MHSSSQLAKVIGLVSHDHTMIRECIDNYKLLCDGASAADRIKALQQIRKITEGVLEQHFAKEDTRIFPAVAEMYPIPSVLNCLRELKEEHILLLAQAHQLNGLLAADEAGQVPDQNLNRKIMDFLVKFGHHAMREDELFDEVNRLIYSIGTKQLAEDKPAVTEM